MERDEAAQQQHEAHDWTKQIGGRVFESQRVGGPGGPNTSPGVVDEKLGPIRVLKMVVVADAPDGEPGFRRWFAVWSDVAQLSRESIVVEPLRQGAEIYLEIRSAGMESGELKTRHSFVEMDLDRKSVV